MDDITRGREDFHLIIQKKIQNESERMKVDPLFIRTTSGDLVVSRRDISVYSKSGSRDLELIDQKQNSR